MKISKKVLTQRLDPLFLKSLEEQYSPDKLNDLASRQNQSPDSILHWCDLTYLKDFEVLGLLFLGIASKNKTVRTLILETLTQRAEKLPETTFGGPIEKALFFRMVQDHLKRGLPMYSQRWKVFWHYFSQRKILGILSDPAFKRSMARRFHPKLRNSLKARKGQRIRGYRDHGTCRPSHKWLPRFDFSLTREQWNLEQLRELDLEFLQVFLTNPFWVAFSRR